MAAKDHEKVYMLRIPNFPVIPNHITKWHPTALGKIRGPEASEDCRGKSPWQITLIHTLVFPKIQHPVST